MLCIKKIIIDILNKFIFLKVINIKIVINLYLYDSKYNICIRMVVLVSFGVYLNFKKKFFYVVYMYSVLNYFVLLVYYIYVFIFSNM